MPLNESIADLTRTLESLQQRLQQLGHGDLRAGPAERREAAEPPSAAAPSPLAGVGEILSLSSIERETADVFALALERIADALAADRAVVLLHDRERDRLLPRAARGFRRGELDEVALPPGESVIGRAFAERRPLSYSRPPEGDDDPFAARFPTREAIAVPIHVSGEPAGVLFAGRRQGGSPFTVEQTLVALLIADQLGAALAHDRLSRRVAAHVDRLNQLGTFSEQAVVGADLGRVLAAACDTARRLTRVTSAALCTWTPDGGLVLAAASGLPAERAGAWQPEAQRGLVADVLATQRAVTCADLDARVGPDEPALRALGARSCAVVPLRADATVVGVLYLIDTRPRELSADEVETVQLLASMAGLAIRNDRLFGAARSAVDELRAAQERLVQTEKTRALGAMAGGVAHEFNNILAIILGKAQLMLARAPEEAVREGLGVIEEAAWRAAGIVRRLQGFGAGGMENIQGAVDVNAVVRDAVTLTRAIWKDEAEARGVRIDVITDLEGAMPVAGNATSLREAMTNLVLNGIDAMPGGGRLGLSTRASDGGVTVTVEDTGQGMSEETRARIFDPFFTTRHPLRSGLGLSVVHGIVARHGGRIEVASQLERGTTVTLWLPAERPAEPVPEVGLPAEEAAEPRGAAILVLEDEESIRRTLVEMLTREGHVVDSAPDGLTGLARFQRGHFDVVLTDLSLPECSGLDVARSVKRMRPGTPVVLITGWGHLLEPARLRESGVDLMLVKPFGLEGLLAVLEEALRLRSTP